MDFELGTGIRVDTARLIDTRLLIQANSGGGKSWALRRNNILWRLRTLELISGKGEIKLAEELAG